MIYSIAHALAHSDELVETRDRRRVRGRRPKPLKGLRFSLDGKVLYFKTLDDFSFAIECRTSVPSARFNELLGRPTADLWHEADSIKAVEKNLVSILEDALCDASPCGPAIRGLGLQIFSNDHDWRSMMEALNELSDEYDGYKRLALIKYMQYLGARQEVLRLIFAVKNKADVLDDPLFDDSDEAFGTRETVLFDTSQLQGRATAAHQLERLPQGEAVRIYALPGHAVEMRLAKHACKLINDNGWALIDPQGDRYPLAKRQNMIGRGSDNDITLGSGFRNVSRRHLIAEPIDDHVILLTDISSHGTFAPAPQTERGGI